MLEHEQRLDDLLEIKQRSFLRKGTLLLHETVQSATVAVLIDEVVIIGSLEHIDVFDDKWTRLERGEDIDFVDSAFLEFGDLFELFCLNHLDGHFLLGDQVNRLVNLRIHALSQLLFQLVILDYLAHHLIITQLYAA